MTRLCFDLRPWAGNPNSDLLFWIWSWSCAYTTRWIASCWIPSRSATALESTMRFKSTSHWPWSPHTLKSGQSDNDADILSRRQGLSLNQSPILETPSVIDTIQSLSVKEISQKGLDAYLTDAHANSEIQNDLLEAFPSILDWYAIDLSISSCCTFVMPKSASAFLESNVYCWTLCTNSINLPFSFEKTYSQLRSFAQAAWIAKKISPSDNTAMLRCNCSRFLNLIGNAFMDFVTGWVPNGDHVCILVIKTTWINRALHPRDLQGFCFWRCLLVRWQHFPTSWTPKTCCQWSWPKTHFQLLTSLVEASEIKVEIQCYLPFTNWCTISGSQQKRVIILRHYCASAPSSWSKTLSIVQFAWIMVLIWELKRLHSFWNMDDSIIIPSTLLLMSLQIVLDKLLWHLPVRSKPFSMTLEIFCVLCSIGIRQTQ